MSFIINKFPNGAGGICLLFVSINHAKFITGVSQVEAGEVSARVR